ncbi:MAG: UDP-glucose 4-epimerase GalE, partial [Defluviitaleaceae bacterium]|nr:UDP-glucose 4-epimerase GalE [Defluviitaleaceae bacterium]
VTGLAGYIGSHTAVVLMEAGHEIVGIDNFHNSDKEAVARIKEISGRDFPFYEMDLLDLPGIDKIFAENKIDCIMHFAGFKAVAESVAKPLEYYDNNLNSTMNLCKMMDKYKINKLVFSSSATVYLPDNPMPLIEGESRMGAINPYGWTKFMSEQILTDGAAANGWSVVLLRYFNPVGAHPSGKIGENPSGIPNNLMPYIAQAARGQREFLPIFGNDYETPDGTGVRDYIHIMDLARGHLAAMDYCAGNGGVESFNLGTGKGYSVLELVTAFEAASGIDIPKKFQPRRAGDAAISYSDPSKAEKLLNWKANLNLEDMCRDTWNYQKQI